MMRDRDSGQRKQECDIPTDNYTLIGIGVAAVVVAWLAFSVLKKVFGLVLLAVLVGVGFLLWQNPELAQWARSLWKI
jgi:hypothetical protein